MDFDSLPDNKSTAPQGSSGSFDSLVDDEDKFGGVSGEAKALTAGVARGATFGLSDQAMTKSGLVNPETLKGLQETNPTSSLAGEVVGTVAPLFVGDEAGVANLPKLVSKLGSGTERAVAKLIPEAALGARGTSIAAKAAGFGTEGALYGLGNSISENALGDHDLVSQQTLANIGMSAAFAGGLGSLVGGFTGKTARAVLDASSPEEKILAQKATEAIDPLSPEGALVNTAGDASDKISMLDALKLQKENAPEIIKAAETIGAPLLPAQTSASKFIQDATSSLSKTPSIPGVITQQAVQKGVDAVDNVMKSTLGGGSSLTDYEAGSLIKNKIQDVVDDLYKPLKEGYLSRAGDAGKVQLGDEARLKLWNGLQDQAQKFGSVGSEGGKLIEQYAEKALAQNSVSQMDELISEIGEKQRAAFRAGETSNSKALGMVADELKDFQIREIVKQGKTLAKSIGPEAEELANQAVEQHKQLTAKYREFKGILGDLASDAKLGKRATTAGGIETTLDELPNEKVVSKFFNAKNVDGLARLKDKFPEAYEALVEQRKSQILSASMDDGKVKIGKVLNELDKLSPEMRKLMFSPEELEKLNASKVWMESLPKDLNPSGTGKAIAFQHFLTNPVKATGQNFMGYATQKLIDHFAGSPQEASKIMTLANTQAAAQKTANRVNSSISDILGKAARPASEKVFSKIENKEDYKKKTDEIVSQANNFSGLTDKISDSTSPLFQHAPNISNSMKMSMGRSVQFLATKIPQNSPENIFSGRPDPSATEISKFKRYYDVAQDPLVALKQVKTGNLLPETIETLNAVYPDLYNHMKLQMMDKLGAIKDKSKIPYATRVSIGQFMGQPLDESMQYQTIMGNQAVYQTQGAQPQGQQKPKPTQSGLSKITLANRTGINQLNDT